MKVHIRFEKKAYRSETFDLPDDCSEEDVTEAAKKFISENKDMPGWCRDGWPGTEGYAAYDELTGMEIDLS